MDGPPAQSLGVEPVHGAIVKRPPRKAGAPVISMRLMLRVLSSGALIVVGTLWVFSLGMKQAGVRPDTNTYDCMALLRRGSFEDRRCTNVCFLVNRAYLTGVVLHVFGMAFGGQIYHMYVCQRGSKSASAFTDCDTVCRC